MLLYFYPKYLGPHQNVSLSTLVFLNKGSRRTFWNTLTNDVPPVGPSRKLSDLFELRCSTNGRLRLIHEGQMSVTRENICTKYLLTAKKIYAYPGTVRLGFWPARHDLNIVDWTVKLQNKTVLLPIPVAPTHLPRASISQDETYLWSYERIIMYHVWDRKNWDGKHITKSYQVISSNFAFYIIKNLKARHACSVHFHLCSISTCIKQAW